MHGDRPHSSSAPMINAQSIPDRLSFATAKGISSSSSHSLISSSSLRLGSIPASSECPAGVRFTALSLRRLTSDTEAPVSTKAFTFLSPSNTSQVKSGPSFSKRYICAFLLPVCSLPSSRFLDNRDVGVVRIVPFGVVHLSPARTGSSQVTRPSTAPTPLQLDEKCPTMPHVQPLCLLLFYGMPQRRFPDTFPSRQGAKVVLSTTTFLQEERPTTERKEKYLTRWWRFNCVQSRQSQNKINNITGIFKCNEQKNGIQKVTYLRSAALCFVSFSSFFWFLIFSSLCPF
ncbi:unnamed protein product [Acanthosepion pharaonis]|uniref:Uncharacterized protein n=1 Tax=Acanthosepion pharaonis TaxID=158019 RepID=A0A812ECD3_ACAPH|nr:unnamed protein product [Sepia pharaonis]